MVKYESWMVKYERNSRSNSPYIFHLAMYWMRDWLAFMEEEQLRIQVLDHSHIRVLHSDGYQTYDIPDLYF